MDSGCSQARCLRAVYRKGYCAAHYNKWKRLRADHETHPRMYYERLADEDGARAAIQEKKAARKAEALLAKGLEKAEKAARRAALKEAKRLEREEQKALRKAAEDSLANLSMYGLSPIYTHLWLEISDQADKRGYIWDLSPEEFTLLLCRPCYYCGRSPIKRFRRTKAKSFGIDRVDNSRGYVKENCVPACWSCNSHKGGSTLTAWAVRLERIVRACHSWKPLDNYDQTW